MHRYSTYSTYITNNTYTVPTVALTANVFGLHIYGTCIPKYTTMQACKNRAYIYLHKRFV